MRELPENIIIICYVCGAVGSVSHAMGYEASKRQKNVSFQEKFLLQHQLNVDRKQSKNISRNDT